jgi:hypothetical protein
MDYTTINSNNSNTFLKKPDTIPEETILTKPEKETLETLVEKKVKWSNENEKILVEWGDIAACNKWLHTESCKLFTKHNIYFAIPIIVVSTITGALSFVAAGFKKEHLSSYLQMSVGSANIIVGIMSTVHQFLNIAGLKEMHRAAYISWDKLHRNIRVELAKAPDERGDANHFIKLCRQEYDRLTEISPIICPSIIYLFFEVFSGEPGSDQRRRFELLKKPDVCNCITSLDETRLMSFDKTKPRMSSITAINANMSAFNTHTPPFQNSRRSNEPNTPNYKAYTNKLNNTKLMSELDKLKIIADQTHTRRQTISSAYDTDHEHDYQNNVIYSDEFHCSSPAPNFNQYGRRRSSSSTLKDIHKNNLRSIRNSTAFVIDSTLNTVKQAFFKENHHNYSYNHDADEESNIKSMHETNDRHLPQITEKHNGVKPPHLIFSNKYKNTSPRKENYHYAHKSNIDASAMSFVETSNEIVFGVKDIIPKSITIDVELTDDMKCLDESNTEIKNENKVNTEKELAEKTNKCDAKPKPKLEPEPEPKPEPENIIYLNKHDSEITL